MIKTHEREYAFTKGNIIIIAFTILKLKHISRHIMRQDNKKNSHYNMEQRE